MCAEGACVAGMGASPLSCLRVWCGATDAHLRGLGLMFPRLQELQVRRGTCAGGMPSGCVAACMWLYMASACAGRMPSGRWRHVKRVCSTWPRLCLVDLPPRRPSPFPRL